MFERWILTRWIECNAIKCLQMNAGCQIESGNLKNLNEISDGVDLNRKK